MTIESLFNDLYYPCCYKLDGIFFQITIGLFAKNFSEDALNSFRYVTWDKNNIKKLESIANNTNKSIIFGTHDNDKINTLKSVLKDQCLVISVDYTEQSYKSLLDNVVRYHLYLNNFTDYEHYSQVFDQMQLIPKSSYCSADYHINFDDFSHKETMQKHFQNLGYQFPNSYYDNWLTSAIS